MNSNALRGWLQQEGLYDVDVEKCLIESGVDSEESYTALSETDLKEFERKVTVMRAKDLKDADAKARSEKKLNKLRKIWEKANGKNTQAKVAASGPADSDEKSQGGHGGNVSAAANNEALAKARGLKAWMQKEGIFEKDLFGVLVAKGIVGLDNIASEFVDKMPNRKDLDDVVRDVRVLRAQEIKDSAARQRLDKTLTKFEKRWETMTGNKKTNIAKGSKADKGQTKADPKEEALSPMATTGHDLKQWMQKENCWQKDLFDNLMSDGFANPDDLAGMTTDQFDEIIRKVRVARAAELKDAKAKSRLEKLLSKFEKEWRKASGITKTTQTKNTKKGKKKQAKAPAEEKVDEMQSAGKDLKKYMQKEKFWQLDLFNELLALGVNGPDELKTMKNKAFQEIVRKVRVARAAELKDATAKSRLDKTLGVFEKEWRKQSGITKTNIKKGSKAAKGGKKAKAPKDAKNDEMATTGQELKAWMKKESIWNKDLYDALLAKNVTGFDDLTSLDQNKMDAIIREVRVEKVAQLKDQAARNRVDKLLTNFEKKWKAACA